METQGPHLKAIAELEKRWEREGSGVSADEMSLGTIRVDRLKTDMQVFQPRLREDAAQAIEQNIFNLQRLLKMDDDVQARGFDPLLIFPIGGEWYVIDGHCRLRAYLREERSTCRVVAFRGSFRAARVEAARRNSEVRLTLGNTERNETAWSLVVSNHQLRKGSRDWLSHHKIAKATSLPPSNVYRMVRLCREGIEDKPEWNYEKLQLYSWKHICLVMHDKDTGGGENTEEFRRERALMKLTTAFQRLLKGLKDARDPLGFLWEALHRAIGADSAKKLAAVARFYTPEVRASDEDTAPAASADVFEDVGAAAWDPLD
jgi:hypothetical protein